MNYKDSGVDIEAGYKSVNLIKKHVKSTFNQNVITDIGGFGGLFSLAKYNYKEPVLVSGTDGVGTKLKLAFLMNKHDTIGIDCVAMCVNDIICSGAKPLFFLDYLAVSKNKPEKIEEIVKGVAEGCRQAGCALIGGETAEMPGFYKEDEYDIAGFAVGIVDKDKIIDGSKISKGDSLIGISSSGFHSNGYSLIRKAFNLTEEKVNDYIEVLEDKLGNALIEPTKIYVNSILQLIDKYEVKGIANITGGGFYENIPRMTSLENLSFKINKDSWKKPKIFNLIEKMKIIEEEEMFKTFNMGIGMVLTVDKDITDDVVNFLDSIHEKAFKIGEVISGDKGVILC